MVAALLVLCGGTKGSRLDLASGNYDRGNGYYHVDLKQRLALLLQA